VPRFYEKLHAGIVAAIEAKPWWQQTLARWAIRAGDRRARATRDGTALSATDRLAASVAESLVLRRIRGVMGGNLRYLVSGFGADAGVAARALSRARLPGAGGLRHEREHRSGSANRPQCYRFSTVGRPMAGSEVKLARTASCCCAGRGFSAAIWVNLTPATGSDADGFLASGDYAGIDAEGFVSLHGRKSEVFKTSTGRRIAPAIVESHLRQIPYVEHTVLFGANRPFVAAVLAVSEAALAQPAAAADRPTPTCGQPPRRCARTSPARTRDLPDYLRPAGRPC